jgi:hypothetical protein
VVIVIAVVAFVVVIFGSIALGRWLQAKGREMERNSNDTD